jgi:hypothetical protein
MLGVCVMLGLLRHGCSAQGAHLYSLRWFAFADPLSVGACLLWVTALGALSPAFHVAGVI